MKNFYEEVRKIGSDTKGSHKYGLLRVSVIKTPSAKIGFSWVYTYFDIVEEVVKTISSIDLKTLRIRVESRGLEWCVTDIDKASLSYKINDEVMDYYNTFLKNSVRKRAKYGVKYVYREVKGEYKYWRFNNKIISVTGKTLLELKEKVLSRGMKWDIIYPDIYEKILEGEYNE